MYKLYHQTLCPFSRKIRFLLAGKGIDFELVKENFWERRKEFIAMNNIGTVPVLFDTQNGDAVSCSYVIAEYVEEKYPDTKSFINGTVAGRAEARRIQYWFDQKFFHEVSKHILNERFYNRFLPKSPSPNSSTLITAKHNLEVHLNYMEFLLENRKYLAGDELSIADMSAAGHISTLDFFGDVPWRNHYVVKEWYSLIKSHKSFAAILADRVPNIVPPLWYNQIDF